MKSPKDMRIIQIDVTNACIHQCSNCTRFCGHHKTPFFMGFDTFRRAVDSLDGYVGTVGIMGGEPTLHPEFSRLVEYLGKKRSTKKGNPFIRPQAQFMDAIHDMELEYTELYDSGNGIHQTVNGTGLWSAMGRGYKKYYEVIHDNIQYQALNDHSNPMYHQPVLITRKELGISDNEWLRLRDACWIQNLWSATITPKGAFFCEIAGALDMLFDGPGGWPIEPGWWKRKPEEFGDQLQWCEFCGIACQTFTRDANEEMDDVSPMMYDRLKQVESPRLKSGHVNLLDIVNGEIASKSKAAGKRFAGNMPYSESYSARFNEEKATLMHKELVGVLVLPKVFSLEKAVENTRKFQRSIILTSDVLPPEAVDAFISNGNTECRHGISLGHVLYNVLHEAKEDVFAVVLEGECTMQEDFFREMHSLVLNPGTFHTYTGYGNAYFGGQQSFSVSLITGRAASVHKIGWDRILRVETMEELRNAWEPTKVIPLDTDMTWTVPTSEILSGKKYVVYGAGQGCFPVLERIESSGGEIVLLVDSDARKHGEQVRGITICAVEHLFDEDVAYDAIVISTSIYYREVKKWLLEKGIPVERLVLP